MDHPKPKKNSRKEERKIRKAKLQMVPSYKEREQGGKILVLEELEVMTQYGYDYPKGILVKELLARKLTNQDMDKLCLNNAKNLSQDLYEMKISGVIKVDVRTPYLKEFETSMTCVAADNYVLKWKDLLLSYPCSFLEDQFIYGWYWISSGRVKLRLQIQPLTMLEAYRHLYVFDEIQKKYVAKLSVEKNSSGREYKVKDMSQADIGRHELDLVEVEMPGLMSCRNEYGPNQPLKGARITGSLHMTIQTAVLIETLTALGAEVRWCSCNIFSTQDHAAAAVARDSAAVFAWKGETLQEYWWCTERALDWGPEGGPDLIIDNGGDATLLIHEGVKAEEEFEKSGKLPDPSSTDNARFQIVLTIIRNGLETDPKKYFRMKQKLVGVSAGTTRVVKRLYQMQMNGTLLFPAINVNDSVTKSKFENLYECRHSLPDSLIRATDIMIAGKVAVVCGYGHVGKGCAAALKQGGARVIVTEIDPICALQALMEGFQVLTLDGVVADADIFVTTTSNKDIIMVNDMRKMKNNAIVCNIGHSDNEIDMNGLEAYPGVKRITIKPQTDRWVFPDTKIGIIILAEGHLMNLGCATGHPSFVMSCSFTNQVIAQLELWKEKSSGKYEKKVYLWPKHLDEKVARLHLGKLGARLTKLSNEQTDNVRHPC